MLLNFTHSHSAVLVMILRLRQLCCHPNLILVSKPCFLGLFHLIIHSFCIIVMHVVPSG